MATAVLVDGDFYLRRYRALKGNHAPAYVAKDLHTMCLAHLEQKDGRRDLFRIYFYDCPPISRPVENPITGEVINFSETPTALWRLDLLDNLKKLRKVAVRMGTIDEDAAQWILRPQVLQQVLSEELSLDELEANDVVYDARRKGIEMLIGIDIATMAYKHQVDQMILIAGDSDFVPAAKLARREGVDFVLDPMWAGIRPDLHEHIDGLRTIIPRANDFDRLPTAQEE